MEDLDICSECGGMCCMKSGCDYAISDFDDLSYKGLLNVLSEGKISIVAVLDFKVIKDGKMIVTPLLYLRARNVNRDIVDLLSMKNRCSQHTDSGCSYSYRDRPFGGKNLVPVRIDEGACYPEVSPIDVVKGWEKYQTVLRKVVKNYTGKTVEDKLKEDAYILMKDYFNGNFEGVSPVEIEDVRRMIPLLKKVYPEETKRALQSDKPKVYNFRNMNFGKV